MAKISVIAIFYNSEKYIEKCLESILNQKNVDLEIIAVNDCSKDSTATILDRYKLKYSNIKVVNHSKNTGIAEARNSGLKHVSGDCFFLIDGDDYLPDEYALYHLAKQWSDDVDWVQGSYIKVDEQGTSIGRIIHPDGKYEGYKSICENFEFLDFIYTHNKLMNSEFARFKFEKGMYHEDRLWNAKIFPDLKKIISISQPTYSYVIRKGQESSLARSKPLYIESGIVLMQLMVECPDCWNNIRDTFQIVDIEKPLYLWCNNREFRIKVLKKLRSLNNPLINMRGFPRFTILIHTMIAHGFPDLFINFISKAYMNYKRLCNSKI